MIKAEFGQRLRSKRPVARMSEASCEVLHNTCCVIQSMREPGIEPIFRAAFVTGGTTSHK
ncbi:MAG TPA: hypothetical protein VIP46_00650 [Pyrinomonadaceae bacterium]